MNYDTVAQDYAQYGQHATTDWILGYQKVLATLKKLGCKRVLDYGCGDGKFTRLLDDAVGVDVSKEMIALAKKQGGEYYHLDDQSLPQGCDAAVVNFVLCTVDSRQEIVTILKKIHASLLPNSYLILLNPNWEQANGREFISYRFLQQDKLESGQAVTIELKSSKNILLHEYFWSKEDYISMIESAQFHISKVEDSIAVDNSQSWIDEKAFSPISIITAEKK